MELSREQRLLRKIEALFKEAIDKYQLIEEGDRLLIGLSGGKDSLALVEFLAKRSQIWKPRFDVRAVHIKMTNIPYASDEEYLNDYCQKYGIPFDLVETSFDLSTDNRKSPCFLCSWNRRKSLFSYAKEHHCNKIVLAHHQDDVLETLLMNMTFQGSIGTMPPKLEMSKFDMTIIRPFCLVPESLLQELAVYRQFKKQIKNCPYEKKSHRADMKKILAQIELINPYARYHLWSSMTHIQSEYLPEIPIK